MQDHTCCACTARRRLGIPSDRGLAGARSTQHATHSPEPCNVTEAPHVPVAIGDPGQGRQQGQGEPGRDLQWQTQPPTRRHSHMEMRNSQSRELLSKLQAPGASYAGAQDL